MIFLSPLLLLFGLTAGVPVVLHLYRQRQRTVMPFSTSRFFTRAIIRAQRRLRLRRILLLILRVAACVLIALAVAQPILRGLGMSASAGDRDVVIVLDDSLSMQAADRPRASRFDQARQQVVQMLRQLSGGDRAAVITFTGRTLGEGLSDDPAGLAGLVDATAPSFAAGDANAAIARAIDLLDSSRHRRRLVVVVSDLQTSDWSGATWPQPHEPLDIVLYRIGDPPRENLSLDSMAVSPGNLVVGQPASVTMRLVNHGATAREMTLKLTVNDAEQSRRKIKLLGGGSDVQTIPLEFASAAEARVVATIDPKDALAADDALYATVNVAAQMPVLLIDGQSAQTQGTPAQRRNSAAFYLRAAMLASGQSETTGPALRADLIAPAQLVNQTLDGYRVIVLSAVRSLPPQDWGKIDDFARHGGGVAVFLGDNADPSFYNESLKPLTVTPAASTEPANAGQAMHVHRIEQGHPLFARFDGETRGAILGLSIYQTNHIDPAGATVLATMDEDRPLAIERDLGRGRMILWATAPVPASTNLPLRRAFIPLMSQMVSYLAGGAQRESAGAVGRALDLPVGKYASGMGLQVRRPDGSAVAGTTAMRGALTIAHLDPGQISLPGFYELAKSDSPADKDAQSLQAVNSPRSESSPAALQQADLDRCAGLWHATLAAPATDDIASLLSMRQGWSGWWDSLLWITLAIVLAESLLAARQSGTGGRSGGAKLGLLALRGVAIACVVIGILHVRWQSTSHKTIRPTLAVMLDDSRSMSEPLGKATRYGQASRIEKQLSALLPDRVLVLFDALGRGLSKGAKPQATGDRSPLVSSLVQIQRAISDKALAGIIVLSDGIDTDRSDGSAIDSLGAPVYPIEVVPTADATAGAVDLTIDAISVNDRTLVGNTVRVVADVSARGNLDSQAVAVSILQGDKPLRTTMINWPNGAASQRAEIEFTPLVAGRMTFALQAGPIDKEKNLDDNRRFFSIDVRAKPITVLYIDGVLRWEAKFLREALSGDPDLNLITSIRTMPGAGGGSRGLLLPEQLAKIDVVILGDVDASFFSAAEVDALRQWVTERGGGLLLTGGYHSFGPAGIGRTDLRQILPVEFSAMENPQADQPFSLRLTEIGLEHPIFSFSSDRVRDTRFVQSLPRLDGCSRVAGVKPGAEVLAVNPGVSAGDGSALPVMVAQQVGSGRSMVFAVDTTWRWRMVVGGFTGDSSFYQRFWGQVVRWLARGEKSKNAVGLELSASRASVEPGKSVEIQAMIRQTADGAKSATTMWRVSGKTLDSMGNPATLTMAQAPDGSYRGTIAPKQPGRFDVIVTAQPVKVGNAPGDDATPLTQEQAITIDVQKPDIEILNTTADPMWLRRIAQRSGGQYLKASDLDAWAKTLPREPVEIESTKKVELWRSPWLVAIFLSVLCAEWIIRRIDE